jgi:hypothetical protein
MFITLSQYNSDRTSWESIRLHACHKSFYLADILLSAALVASIGYTFLVYISVSSPCLRLPLYIMRTADISFGYCNITYFNIRQNDNELTCQYQFARLNTAVWRRLSLSGCVSNSIWRERNLPDRMTSKITVPR